MRLVIQIALGVLVALACLLAIGLAVGSLVNDDEQGTDEIQGDTRKAMRGYLQERGATELRNAIDNADAVKLSDGFSRVCLRPASGSLRCFFVDTKPEPPTVRADPSRAPNSP